MNRYPHANPITRLTTAFAMLFAALPVIVAAHEPTVADFLPNKSHLANAESNPAPAAGEMVLLASEIHVAEGAAWVRARFETVSFPGFEPGAPGHLRITSLYDGAVQYLNAVDFERWHHRSAYFNGDAIRIEAFGYDVPGSVTIDLGELRAGFAGDPSGAGAPRTICGSLDERQLSSDPRVARVVISEGDFPSVCTTAIVDDANRCFLTSGGCANALDNDAVIEFDAPLTFPDGTTLNHPPPEDQYVPDLSSVQSQTGGNGSDWGYFGCFANSNSGLSPAEAQGGFFVLASDVPAEIDPPTRVYGNGATVPPVFRTWSFVLKSALGPLTGVSGTILQVEADATAGDSGAAVIDDATGEMIGVLTNDGCGEFTGANVATSVTNAELRKALTQPLGICVPLTFSYPNGLPEMVDPAGGTEVPVIVSGANGTEPVPGTGEFHYDVGDGWVTVPMTELVPNEYVATFPPAECGATFAYYFSVETSTGTRFPDQIENPVSTFETVAATGITTIADFNFEDATGWSVQDVNVTAGSWVQGVPASNGNDNAPTDDFDGSGQCYVTGLAQGVDLDGGPTRLRSPTYDLSAANNPFLSYAFWFWTDDPVSDNFLLQMSDNGGLFWSTVNTAGNQGRQWVERRFRIADLGPLSAATRFRFAVSDFPNNSTTEAAIDAFTIIDYECDSVVDCLKGDVNEDTMRDGGDVAGFTDALTGGAAPGSTQFCAADMDNDGTLEIGDDVALFVQCLVGDGCP